MSDPGQTHFLGDDCEGGHRERVVIPYCNRHDLYDFIPSGSHGECALCRLSALEAVVDAARMEHPRGPTKGEQRLHDAIRRLDEVSPDPNQGS